MSVRSGSWEAIFFQFLPPNCSTASRRRASSDSVHFPIEARRLLLFVLSVVLLVGVGVDGGESCGAGGCACGFVG